MAMLAAAAWASGAAVLRGVAWPELGRAERAALEITAGLGIVSTVLTAALLRHAFSHSVLLLAAVTVCGAAIVARRPRPATRRATAAPVDAAAAAGPRRTMAIVAVGALVACAGAIAPVTDHDALSYIVPIARHIAREGTLRVWTDQAPSIWPQGHTVLLAFIVQRGGDRLAALSAFEWLAALGAIAAFARRVCARAGDVPLAIAMAIAAPAAAFQVSAAKEDLLLLAATAGALFCLAGPLTIGEAAAAGLFAGVAAGAKYPGLGVAIAVVTWIAVASPRGVRAGATAAAVAGVAAIAGVWYALNVWRFGNPVAPFVFGAAGTPLDAATVRATMDNYGGGRGVLNVFATPLRIFLESSTYGGRAALFHPIVYLGIAAAFDRRWRGRAAPLLFTAAVLYAGWYLTLQHARLLLPAALALAPAAAAVVSPAMTRSRLARVAVVAAVGVPLLLAPIVGLVRAARYLSDPAAYLERETEHYSGIAWANANLDPARHRILSVFGVVGYLTIPAIGLDPLHQLEFDQAAIADHRRRLDECRARGVTHIFTVRHELDDVAEQLRVVYENPASRLGDTHFFRAAPVDATAIFEIVNPPASPVR
jgi:hypothetical protein